MATKTAPKKAASPKPSKSQGGTAAKSNTRSNGGNQQTAAPAKGNGMLEEYFNDAIKDIYWAEKALTKALPKMQKAATTEELKTAIDEHLAQTEEHVARLEQVFQLLGKKAQAKKCEAMDGIIKEGESIVEETEKGTMTRDVGIIMAAQKVEHYEISTYGGLVQLANVMGLDEVSSLLAQTLQEEKETDQSLSGIAENDINWEAEMEGGEEGEEGTEEE